jgi:hypothetical protein
VNALLRSHFAAFAFFVPFAAMLAVHRMLGLSDALMVAPAPGQPHSMLYNMLMILAFYFGVGGYILHVAVIAERSPIWVVVKCALLVVMWAGIIWALE